MELPGDKGDTMNQYDVVVIGGGPAGMMAAISAARLGAAVCILEHKERVGAKILMTGNGKCNLTNYHMTENCFRSDSGTDFFHVVKKFDQNAVVDFFEGLGMYTHERSGYVYPLSDQASTVLDFLRNELANQKVDVFVGCDIQKISDHFIITAKQGKISCKTMILACGSKAAPKTGSDGSGYLLAKNFGHSVNSVIPALTQVKCTGEFWKECSGVRVAAKISVISNQEVLDSNVGELQLADYGISGIPTFIVSRTIKRAMERNLHPMIQIRFLPDLTDTQVENALKHCMVINAGLGIAAALNGLLPKKLASVLVKKSGLNPNKLCKEVSAKEELKLLQTIISFEVTPYDTAGFDQAQVCAGGVMLHEIDMDTMMSKLVPGLYFAGELLDVDGICGGYNLQWAFSSGNLAGESAARMAKKV